MRRFHLVVCFFLLAVALTVCAYAEGYDTDQDIIITLDHTEIMAGDTVTATYRKMNSDIVMLSASWSHDNAWGNAYDFQDADQGSTSYTPTGNGIYYFHISYQDAAETVRIATSESVIVNGYVITADVTGATLDHANMYYLDAGSTTTVSYEITGGYDDYYVNVSWYGEKDGARTLLNENTRQDRSGTTSCEAPSSMDRLCCFITVDRGNGVVIPLGGYTNIQLYFEITGESENYDTNQDIIITLDRAAIMAGDTVTASYRKVHNGIVLLNASWSNNNWSLSASGFQDADQGSTSYAPTGNGIYYFHISYQDAGGTIRIATSETVMVNGYVITADVNGATLDHLNMYHLDAGSTASVNYEITGGYDDFYVNVSWYGEKDGTRTQLKENTQQGRSGTTSFEAPSSMDRLNCFITVDRGNGVVMPLGGYCDMQLYFEIVYTLYLPNNLRRIESQTFANLSPGLRISIPDSVEYIDVSAFENSDVTLIVSSDSYAFQYALENNMQYSLID